MGLDMYIYIGENKRKIKKGEYQRKYYYRKYNFLFKYLADNIKAIRELDNIDEINCSYVKLNVRAIKKLVKYCKEILADNSKATKLLPTCEGLFFL